MAINWVLPVRAVQFVLSVVVLGLMAYARASTAISALSWLAWAVTFVFGAISVVKGRNGSMSFGNKAPKNKEVDMHQGV
ncbi:unnamed protein product [Alternaria alternata]